MGEGRGAAPFGEAESRARSARSPPQAGGLRPGARGFCGAGEKGRAGENAGGRGRRFVQTLRKNKGYLLQAGGAAGKIEPSGPCFL